MHISSVEDEQVHSVHQVTMGAWHPQAAADTSRAVLAASVIPAIRTRKEDLLTTS